MPTAPLAINSINAIIKTVECTVVININMPTCTTWNINLLTSRLASWHVSLEPGINCRHYRVLFSVFVNKKYTYRFWIYKIFYITMLFGEIHPHRVVFINLCLWRGSMCIPLPVRVRNVLFPLAGCAAAFVFPLWRTMVPLSPTW